MAYQKGESGNLQGRAKGSSNVRTKLLYALEKAGSSEQDFANNVIDLAAKGNSTALTIIAERLWTRPKSTFEPVTINAPADATVQDKATAILDAALAGQMPSDHASALMVALSRVVEVTAIPELVERIRKLENPSR